ncbi:hypothetical protein, partial [Brevibacillus reuszeri]|uniref:hypothetical protein n=1 Tax=Brevibacillus reuszeri TaxID=54915 RepID=UPI003D25D2F2
SDVVLTSNPSKLTQGSLSQSLTLTVEKDEFINGNATQDTFIFDGDLASLTATAYSFQEAQKIILSVYGTVVKETGQGTLTIKGGFLKGGKDITVSISVE